MTNRNELERLLAAATEGPWQLSAGNETEIQGVPKKQVARAHCGGMTGVRLVEAEANAALIVHLRNNAQHYLSLMNEVERLRTCCDCDKAFSGASQGVFICNQCAGAD